MIRIQNLGKKFQDLWIFRSITLEIPKNASHVFIGPSGSGKSTLLKCVAGLLTADEGHVEMDSSRVGMLFQKNALFDSMTLLQNLVFPQIEVLQKTQPEAQIAAEKMLDAVGLLSSKNLLPSEISGGMQKRLGIARALVVKPEIILYDEPTAGLDPITSRIIAELILGLKKETQSTVLIVTSDISRAQQLGDHITLLAEGQAIDSGRPSELLKHRDPRVQQFVFGRTQGPLTHDSV